MYRVFRFQQSWPFLSFDCQRVNSRKNRRGQDSTFGSSANCYNRLESRELLAGISFTPETGVVFVGGTVGNDSVLVTQSSERVTVRQQGFSTQTFDIQDVSLIQFVGLAGNDRFENRSSVASEAFGQAGNDTLIGGSAGDRLIGNGGNDSIVGNDGDDFIVAGLDDDVVNAGAGNDRVLGVGGNNEIEGGDGDDFIFGGNQVDVIQGGRGDNTIAGGGGDDQLTGGSGVDLIFAGPGNDVAFGNDGDDFIYGQTGEDHLEGGAGADVVNGNGGNDTLLGQSGNDRIIGGPGIDRSVFVGFSIENDVQRNGAAFNITDSNSTQANGSDFLFALEQLDFSDGLHSPDELLNADQPPAGIVERVFVQPIVASNSDGSNTAGAFGNADQQADVLRRIDSIFSQAGIDIEFLPSRQINDTSVNVGLGAGVRDLGDLRTIVQQGDDRGVGRVDSRIIDFYFVQRVPGFSATSDRAANGLAFVGGSGVAVHAGETLVDSAAGRQLLARVAAHEIGHNLGLPHAERDDNLLSDGDGTNLSQAQINVISTSNISRRL